MKDAFIKLYKDLINVLSYTLKAAGKVISIFILAYPLRALWNGYVSELLTLPEMTHIDQAIAVLSIVAILGCIFRFNSHVLIPSTEKTVP